MSLTIPTASRDPPPFFFHAAFTSHMSSVSSSSPVLVDAQMRELLSLVLVLRVVLEVLEPEAEMDDDGDG
jgi:hypothetical protein